MQSASPIVPDASGASSPALPQEPASLSQRIRRFLPYIRHVQRYWIVVLVATIIGAATEPAAPALLKPLLDRGFGASSFNPWLVPAALLLMFAIRGGAGFIADVTLAKIANEGMFMLRRACSRACWMRGWTCSAPSRPARCPTASCTRCRTRSPCW
jgi:hypothetical protein